MNRYGKRIKLDIYGGSHDEKIGMILSGIPAGEAIDMDTLKAFMARRAPGNDPYSTSRKEPDEPVFLSGLDENNVTTGEDIEAVIYNQNQRSGDYSSLADTPRPSHADFAAIMKYGKSVDLRGGGHFSGRLTAPMCIAGGICLQMLARRSIYIGAHIYSVGTVYDRPFDAVNISKRDLDILHYWKFPVLEGSAGAKMKSLIEHARSNGDSVGGIVECAVIGLPKGLGEHMFDSVESAISSIVFGIPAVKGIEFGAGFAASEMLGSENNDPFYVDGDEIKTRTNNAGGILGGMTSGMPLIFRAALKPTPSIAKEQDSVSLSRMENVKITVGGRHDPCIVPRAVPVFEAAAALAIIDLMN
ncbi:MAG: chorismate synthase [Clostridia bacterium]|nr:chorismate synthase [Clostridia bacterium]